VVDPKATAEVETDWSLPYSGFTNQLDLLDQRPYIEAGVQ